MPDARNGLEKKRQIDVIPAVQRATVGNNTIFGSRLNFYFSAKMLLARGSRTCPGTCFWPRYYSALYTSSQTQSQATAGRSRASCRSKKYVVSSTYCCVWPKLIYLRKTHEKCTTPGGGTVSGASEPFLRRPPPVLCDLLFLRLKDDPRTAKTTAGTKNAIHCPTDIPSSSEVVLPPVRTTFVSFCFPKTRI